MHTITFEYNTYKEKFTVPELFGEELSIEEWDALKSQERFSLLDRKYLDWVLSLPCTQHTSYGWRWKESVSASKVL